MIVKWKRLRRIAKEISGKRTVIVASVGDKASRKRIDEIEKQEAQPKEVET